MTKLTHFLISAVVTFGLASGVTYADNHGEAADGPGVMATFACNFKDGKDMDDLRAARDYYVRESGKEGLETPPAYVWNLFKGGVPFDHVWFDLYANLGAFAADIAAYGAADTDRIDERFASVDGDCENNLFTVKPIHMGSSAAPGAETSFITSNACTLRHGISDQDVLDFESHARGVLGSMEAYDQTAIYIATPITHSPNSVDRYIFSVNPSVTAWSDGQAAFAASPGSGMLLRHFNTTFECATSLWFAEQMVAPPEE